MHAVTQQFVEDLKDQTEIKSIQQTLDRHLGLIGFDKFAYLVIRRSQGPLVPLVITSYPEAWALRYHEQNYINADEVVTRAAQSLLPFDWQSVRSRHRDQGHIFDEAGEFGIRNGLTVPVHGPGGELSFLCVSSDANRREFTRLIAEHSGNLHYMALNYHSAVSDLVQSDAGHESFSLSPRERECLLWTARGKSTWEIAEILGLSAETVQFYLNNAKRKAGVYSKHHAVVKAILLGLILP